MCRTTAGFEALFHSVYHMEKKQDHVIMQCG